MPEGGTHLLIVVAVGFLVIGGVLGFATAMDRAVRGGLLQQRTEAMARPDWVSLDDLPASVPAAFLSVVDPEFESGSVRRARGNEQTVPRELVRQIHLLGDGLAGEAQELIMAPVLEQRASRRDILELYLNRVPLGKAGDFAVYGLYYAAREYFGKQASELTLSEAATLAGLLLEPRIEDPRQRPGAVGVRRNEVLRALLEVGAIGPDDYSRAIAERLGFQVGIAEMPMSRRLPRATDTLFIRLPDGLQPGPESQQQ